MIVKTNGDEIEVEKNLCPRGEEFAKEEIERPMRILPTSVRVIGGERELVSVKTSAPIPRDRIFDVMEIIKKTSVKAPVEIGQVIIENVLNLGVDVVATRSVRSSGSTSREAPGRSRGSFEISTRP